MRYNDLEPEDQPVTMSAITGITVQQLQVAKLLLDKALAEGLTTITRSRGWSFLTKGQRILLIDELADHSAEFVRRVGMEVIERDGGNDAGRA